MIVVDSSVMVGLLVDVPGLSEPVARTVAPRFGEELAAPHLIDVEVSSAVHGLARSGRITDHMAAMAVDDLREFHMERYPHFFLLPRVWALRTALTSHESVYLALAEILNAPLLTREERFLDVDSDAEVILAR